MKLQLAPFVDLILVWLALVALLATTVALSFVPMGAGNALASGLIALAKASLVLAFYMHLKHATTLLRLVAMVAAVALGFMFVLSGLDTLTRVVHTAPWQFSPPSLYVEPAPAPACHRHGAC